MGGEMESTGLDKHVADRQIHGKWEKASARQTSTQRGSDVQQIPAARQVSSRKAGASNTPQQTVTNHSVTTVEVEDLDVARKQAFPEGGIVKPKIKNRGLSRVSDNFWCSLSASVQRLKSRDWMWTPANSLTACLCLLNEIREIKRNCRYRVSIHENNALKCTMGPSCDSSLYFALKELRQYAENGVGWQYVEALDCLAGCFGLVSSRCKHKDDCRKAVGEIYQLFFDFELNYLEHIKDSPLRYSVEHAINLIDGMLSDSSPIHHFSFLAPDVITGFRTRKEHLFHVVQTNMSNEIADRTRKNLKESEKMALSQDAGQWLMREYYDELKDRFGKVMEKSVGGDVTVWQRICLLETVVAFFVQYPESVIVLHILHKELTGLISDIIKLILLAVVESTDDVDRLKLELLELVGYLGGKGLLDDNTKKLCLRWTQVQPVMESATKADKSSYAQCKQQIEIMLILSCIQSQARDRSMMAADMLTELLHRNMHMIDALDKEDELLKDIKKVKENIYTNLFLPIVEAYEKIRSFKMSYIDTSIVMSSYQPDVIKLRPYVLLVMGDDAESRSQWEKITCIIWWCDLDILHQKRLFTMEDVNSLLVMKAVVPLVVPQFRIKVEGVLTKFFRFIMACHNEEMFIKEAMELSQWVDDLQQTYRGIEIALVECNRIWKEWKATYDSMRACENIVALSDASVATKAAYACSATTVADIPPRKAIDHCPRMGQQLVTPHMMPHSTASSVMPVSVARASSHAHELSLMPIQGEGDRQQPGVIIKHEPARSRWTKMQEDPAKCSKEAINRPGEAITMCDALSAKVTFVFANNSTLALRLHQYKPIDYGATAMDNSQMVHGQECLLYATGQYLRQRDNGLYDAVSEIHLPTNCGSEQFPVLLRGVRSLTNWLLQANGELTGMDIDEETVHATLMKLGSDNGKPAIHELFNYFIKHQGSIGNFEIMSNLFVLRNYLLFIHSLLELKTDAQPTYWPDKGDATQYSSIKYRGFDCNQTRFYP